MTASGLKVQWARLVPREQRLVAGAAALVAAALLWWLALAPPLEVLRTAEAQHRVLDAQVQRMVGLQAQARALQSQPRPTQNDASRMLEATVREQLGAAARVSISGERVTITLSGRMPPATPSKRTSDSPAGIETRRVSVTTRRPSTSTSAMFIKSRERCRPPKPPGKKP